MSQSKVGDTLTSAVRPAAEPLPGYRDPKPMVYAGLFPIDNAQFPELRDALDKLKLNDAALIYTPETSVALGFGFRCGFLGLLHMEIVNERLSREFGLDLIQTAPNVTYDVTAEDGSQHHVTNPSEFPDGKIKKIVEPMVAADIITPKEFIGAVMDLCQDHRALWARWSTSPPIVSRCTTAFRWRKSCSTSSTSSSPAPRATLPLITMRMASSPPIWSRWTSLFRARRSMRSVPSFTR